MKGLKGSVTVFVMILVGMIIGMFLMGYTPVATRFIETDVFGQGNAEGGDEAVPITNLNASKIFDNIKNTLLSPFGMAVLGFALLFGTLSGLAGSSIGYASGSILAFMLPALLLFMIANLFFFPVVDEATAQGLPPPMNLLLMIVYNTLLLLTILTFISGRD